MSAAQDSTSLPFEILVSLLRPMARLCLKYTIQIQTLLEALKVALVQASVDELRKNGEDPSQSRVSVMTGIHRRDIARLMTQKPENKSDHSYLARVLGQWQSDKKFLDSSGKPRILDATGRGNEFIRLVASVSQDLNPYAVLSELERVGAVKRTAHGVEVKETVYVPEGDLKEGMRLLALDLNDIIFTVEHNLANSPAMPNLHIRTEYNNIDRASLKKVERWLLKQGSTFQEKVRRYLAQYDKDINKKLADGRPGARVALTSFSRIE